MMSVAPLVTYAVLGLVSSTASLARSNVPWTRAQEVTESAPGGDDKAGGASYQPAVAAASDEGLAALARTRVPAGFRLELAAAEPLIANPVCFAFDPKGRIYVAETFRLHKGVTDMREHLGWLEDDIASLTVEDRVAMFRKHEGDQRLAALYGVEHERVRRLEDTDGDGTYDRATVFADGFKDPAVGIAAGLLVRPRVGGGQDVWYTCIPDLWRLTDADDDGVAEAREQHSTGYGVRVALLGHDLHGLTIGLDGRLYFSIGDRGFHVVTREGRALAHAHTGAVLRCELDGADLEVFCTGLRNPQELVFDDRGDLFTGDNNSDGGDRARWTWLLEGSDSGWRQAYQWCNDVQARGPWNAEALWKPLHAGQPAYILPPIANFTDGPSGLALYPGTGFSPEWDGTFFLCDFRGAAGYSGVHSFKNKPLGAGFALDGAREFLWNCLPTDVDFGFDGNLYTLDWVAGWGQTGKGRIFRLEPETRSESETRLVREVQGLLAGGLAERNDKQLVALFMHPDRRVRHEAQLLLAERALAAQDTRGALNVVFTALELLREPGLDVRARTHAAWLVAHIARRGPGYLEFFSPHLVAMVSDDDPEVRVQGLRTVGDLGYADAATWVELALEDSEPRVRLAAAEAAGRLGGAVNTIAVIGLLGRDGESDPWIRHVCVRALERLGDRAAVQRALESAEPALRRNLVVVLRRWADAGLAALLEDDDEAVVAEAADAIHGARVSAAFGALAGLLDRPAGQRHYTLRRALDANRVVGGAESAERLVRFVLGRENPNALRAEALQVLALWTEPRTRDLVIQDRWPLPGRAPAELTEAREALAAGLFVTAEPDVLRAAWVEFVRRQDPSERATAALALVALGASTQASGGLAVRKAALDTLAERSGDAAGRVALQLVDAPEAELRWAALGILGRTNPAVAVERLVAAVHADEEAEAAVLALGVLRDDLATAALVELVLPVEGVEPEPDAARSEPWLVEWFEVAARGERPELAQGAGALQAGFAKAREMGDPLAGWRMTLVGGDATRGGRVFREHAAVTCLKCHRLGGDGGSEAGPDLDGVAARLTSEELLRSIVDPNAALAEGFQNWLLRTDDDEVFVGRIVSESPSELVLETNQKERVTFMPSEITARRRDVSAMPADTASHLSRREMRDLLAFLQAQRGD